MPAVPAQWPFAAPPRVPLRASRTDPGAAIVATWLLLHMSEWVHRRVETCSFVDDRHARRRVSIDFTVPERVEGVVVANVLDFVPLTLLAKRTLVDFDIRDVHDEPIPVLTTHENSTVIDTVLVTYATVVLGAAPSDEVRSVLRDIAAGDAAAADSARSALDDAADGERRRLMENATFRKLVSDLHENFILATAGLPAPPGVRSIVKFSYEHAMDIRPEGFPHWLTVRVGWSSTRLRLSVPGALAAESYHVEVDAPPAVEVAGATLAPGLRRPQARGLPQRLATRLSNALVNRSLSIYAAGPVGRVHLHALPLPLDADPRVVVLLRKARSGFLRSALLTCALATALLWVAEVRLDVVAGEAQTALAVPVLLLAPGLLAAYLVRPDEHPLATVLLVGVRLMLLVSGVCVVTAAVLLVIQVAREQLRFWWVLLALLSSSATAVVALANVLPPAHRRGRWRGPRARLDWTVRW